MYDLRQKCIRHLFLLGHSKKQVLYDLNSILLRRCILQNLIKLFIYLFAQLSSQVFRELPSICKIPIKQQKNNRKMFERINIYVFCLFGFIVRTFWIIEHSQIFEI